MTHTYWFISTCFAEFHWWCLERVKLTKVLLLMFWQILASLTESGWFVSLSVSYGLNGNCWYRSGAYQENWTAATGILDIHLFWTCISQTLTHHFYAGSLQWRIMVESQIYLIILFWTSHFLTTFAMDLQEHYIRKVRKFNSPAE